MQISITGLGAILSYLIASVLLICPLLKKRSLPQDMRKRFFTIGFIGILLHGFSLYPALMTNNGINLGFLNAASLIGLASISLLLISSIRYPIENLCIAFMPGTAIIIAINMAYPSGHTINESLTWQLQLHILLSIFAYSILALAALQALLLSFQERHLHNHHPGGLVRALPPLQLMEDLLFQMIRVGFILLSLALFSGILFLEDLFAQHLVHKTVLSIIAWAVFAILLWGRSTMGWRGRTAIRWTLGGFAFLVLAYFGSKLVLEILL
ncbi:MAG: cytochrome c biogenesis protein CcsA [Gammaproteobacteria bacterium]|nr:cytochrome c biogenesis protein CcsA [Gammaproteobacteria bacterium]